MSLPHNRTSSIPGLGKKTTRFGFIADGWMAPFLRLLILSSTLSMIPALSSQTLESSNPFLPPGYGDEKGKPAPPPVITTNGPISREIEFRGLIELHGAYQFSIFNKKEQKSYWLYQNQPENGISVRGYDADSRSITVNMNGRSERITLMSASNAPLPVVSNPQPDTGNNNQLPPGLENATENDRSDNRRRVIPRRRVVLPQQ